MLKQYLNERNRKVFLEVEYPEDDITIRRIEFYKRFGFNLNKFDYVQPPYEKGKNVVKLKIMSYKDKCNKEQCDEFKNTVYKYVYKTDL